MHPTDKNYWNVIANTAYDAYCDARGWKSVRGEPLPKWGAQDQSLRDAWRAAAVAAAGLHMELTNKP
jgi:hypothetical protein